MWGRNVVLAVATRPSDKDLKDAFNSGLMPCHFDRYEPGPWEKSFAQNWKKWVIGIEVQRGPPACPDPSPVGCNPLIGSRHHLSKEEVRELITLSKHISKEEGRVLITLSKHISKEEVLITLSKHLSFSVGYTVLSQRPHFSDILGAAFVRFNEWLIDW